MRRALLLALVLSAGAAAARAQSVVVRPAGDLSALVGMPLDVPIVADWTARADKLGSFALTLRWDPAVLRYEGGNPGTFGQLTSNADSVSQGVLRLSGANPTGVNGMITLGIGRFTPLDTVGTTLQLQVTELYATAPTFADLLGSAAPQNALYCAARGLWGDADVDGTVGSRDALLALSNAVGLDVSAFPEIGLADVDTSGTADARDALVILSYAVGMDVTGFRLHKLALGSCGTEVQTNYAILPGPDTLVQSQELRLTLQATSTLGAVRTLTDVFWRSSDPTVIAVTQDGQAFAAGAGVVTLVGKSGTTDSAVTTMTVVTRRSRHVVDAAAISAANRIGSSALPFAALDEAARIAAEGDTVLVRPGHYADPGFFNQGVVILGQPGGGGVVLSTGGNPAIAFFNGRRAEVRNITIDNSNAGIEAFGLDTLVVDSLTYTAAAGTCVSAAVVSGDIRQLVVRRSTLTGDGPSGCTTGIDAFGVVQDLTVDSVVFSDLGNDAIYAGTADSVTVRASSFHDLGSSAVDVGASTCCAGRLPLPTSLALVVDGARVARTGYSPIYATELRSAVITHSLVDGTAAFANALALSGPSTWGGYVRLSADTVLAGGGSAWIDAFALDSVSMDNVTASGYAGYMSAVAAARITRSQIHVLSSGYGIQFYADTNVVGLVVDSVTVTGDPSCTQCGEGIRVLGAPATMDRVIATNLNQGVNQSDSTLTVTNSSFSDDYYGVNVSSCCGAPIAVAVRGSQFTNTYYGVYAYNVALAADNLTMSGGYTGVQAGNVGADSVRNSIFSDFQYPISLAGDTLVATQNTIVRSTSDGIQAYGQNLATDMALIGSNSVICDAAGATNAYAVFGSSSNFVVAGNVLSGCAGGVYIGSNSSGLTADVRGNTITAPAAASDAAIHVVSSTIPTVVGNQITGGGYSGAIWLEGFSGQEFSHARVDSNTIRNVADRAIWVSYADTLTARGNLIDTVTNSGYYGSGPVGIGLAYGAVLDSLERNTIRHAARGMEINISGASAALDSNAISATDSAAVWVDAVGTLSMTGNNIQNNHQHGLNNPAATGAAFAVQGNAFVNDSGYAISSPYDSVHAQGNWWGLASGSHSGAGSDSTFGQVDTSAYLTSDPTPGLPPLAPPVRVIAVQLVASTAPATSLPVRTYVAPVRTPRPAPAAVTANPRQAALADRMAAAAGDTSRVARALAPRAERLRARVQADAVRAQQRAQRAATERERQRQAEAARAARAARMPPQKGRAGQ